jgi:hypothetical protein
MTVATVSDFPIMHGLIDITNTAIRRFPRIVLLNVGQEFFPIFGALLGAMAMTSVFIFERSTLFV